jgi:putative flippase GtrA
MIRIFANKQFVTFLITGGIAACVNFLSRILFNQWMTFSSSVVLAYICGMITAFVLAKIFVFKTSRQSIGNAIFYFCLVNAFAVLQTWAISMLLAYYLLPSIGVNLFTHEIAHAVGIIIPVFTSFLGHKYFSFSDTAK